LTSAIRTLNLGVGFPAVRSLTLLSLADPLLSVASTAWMSAVQRKEPVASARLLAIQFHESWRRLAAVRVGRQRPFATFTALEWSPRSSRSHWAIWERPRADWGGYGVNAACRCICSRGNISGCGMPSRHGVARLHLVRVWPTGAAAERKHVKAPGSIRAAMKHTRWKAKTARRMSICRAEGLDPAAAQAGRVGHAAARESLRLQIVLKSGVHLLPMRRALLSLQTSRDGGVGLLRRLQAAFPTRGELRTTD